MGYLGEADELFLLKTVEFFGYHENQTAIQNKTVTLVTLNQLSSSNKYTNKRGDQATFSLDSGNEVKQFKFG